MKILLAYPRGRDRFQHLGLLPPLGIAFISAVLKRDGHQVTIRDENVGRGELRPAELGDYDLVGVSSDTVRYARAGELGKMAKSAGIPVVLGGSHASFMDREILEEGAADYIVRNEGEEIVVNLVRALAGGSVPEGIPGVTYRLRGETIRNPDAPYPQDLDALPLPDREGLGMEHYQSSTIGRRRFTTLLGSRGCPYRCDFCSSPRLAGGVRYRDPVKVVDEMELLVKHYRFGSIAMTDDIFTVHPGRAETICDEIQKRDLDVKWWCCARVDGVNRNQDLYRKMAAAGCYTIFLGIDGGNEATLAEYGKGYGVDEAFEAVRFLHEVGIEVMAAFVIGGIKESRQQMLETISLAKRLKPNTAQFTINTPLPGSELWERSQDRIVDRDFGRYDLFHCVMKLDGVPNPRAVERMLLRAYLSYYILSWHGLRNLGKFVGERLLGLEPSRSFGKPLTYASTQT